MKRKVSNRDKTFWAVVIPVVILFFAFNTLPMIKGVIYSFTNYKGYGSYDYVGFRNYMDLFTDARVGKSYLFTFKYALAGTILVNVLNSGIDLQFSVMKACKNKEAAYEVLRYLYDDDTIQIYLDAQGGIACKDGNFAIPETLEDMKDYIENNRMSDYQDHHYPSEMSVDAMIQTFLLDTNDNAQEKFLKKFDNDWKRYNRDLIRKVQDYQKEQGDAQ